MNKLLIAIVGPTAIGKTNFAMQIAKRLGCEILSADSRQFYKEMQIGTAVPSQELLQQVPHHCVQHKSILDTYTVGDFEKESLAVLGKLFSCKDYAILVGGSGLYVDAVLHGLDVFPKIPIGIRQKIQQDYATKGLSYLQAELKEKDPSYFCKMDIQNPQRIIRALEVCIATQKPFSSFLNQPKVQRPFRVLKIGITGDRQIIYDRINQRVDQMIGDGLLEEAKRLYPHRKRNALQTVGYTELFGYLDARFSLDFAISEIKKNTRRFAKRQLTWYRKDLSIHWFDYQTGINTILTVIPKMKS